MIDTEKAEFARIMTGIAELFGKPMSRELLSIYWMACSDLDLQQFKAAATKAAKTCEFMPKPRDFLAHALDGEMSSLEAWDVALYCVRNGRPMRDPRVIAAANLVGGHKAIGDCYDKDLPFLERRFREAYDEVIEREPIAQRLALVDSRRRVESEPSALPYDKARRVE